ncbi:MAG: sulfite exporter TauE/SafE family protein [Thermoplasmata archaeon]
MLDIPIYVVFILAIIIGILAGFISSLFGVGSGTIIVPAVIFLLGYEFHAAKAVSLLTIVFISIIGVYQHNKFKNVRWKFGLVLGVFGLFGSIVGSIASSYTPANILEAIFGVVLILVAFQMIKKPQQKEAQNGKTLIPLGGFTAGIIGGLLGLGGGIIFVPLMYFIGIPIHNAVGTSLFAVFFTAIFGTATDISIKIMTLEVGLYIGVPLTIGAAIGSGYGTVVANKLKDARLKRYFAIYLIIIAISMLLRSLSLV